MTLQQGLSFAVVIGMMVLFAWDRWRYDVVALVALMAAVACGIVPADKAFSGFSNQLLPLIASVLVMSAALTKSGLVVMALRPIASRLKSTGPQVFVLTSAVAFLSAVVKNVGALAIFIPIAMQMAERSRKPASALLMPMGFAALLGGTMTLIGTSPNLIASSVRQQLYGAPYAMFDFLPVGMGVTLVGIAFLTFGWRLIPRGRKGQGTPDTLFRIEDYLAEARVPPDTPYVGRTVAELEALGEGDLAVTAIIRETYRRYVPAGHWTLFAGDVLVLRSDPQGLERVVAEARLQLVGSTEPKRERRAADDAATVEAVVSGGSLMAGARPAELRLRERHGVNLLAVSQRGRPSARLRRVKFQVGDVVALQGNEADMTDTLAALGLLPLAERRLALGQRRHAFATVLLLACAVTLSATEIVPPAVAFTGAAVIIALARIVPLREIYASIEWPILVMLGALIPVGEAVRDTGASQLVAGWLSQVAQLIPPLGVVAALIAVTMILTPFLHHAAAVIVMAPIAASLAHKLGLHGDPLIMAVAMGASCDFLTPIGHQCNTLVMGPGGYRFGDYWRLGLPLSILVVLIGAPLIALVWPVR